MKFFESLISISLKKQKQRLNETIIDRMNHQKILGAVDGIIQSGQKRDEILLEICRLLDREVEVFDWTGFYLVAPDDENMLELGPYIGEETDHVRIPFGKGICGQAAKTKETFVVQDVSQSENYLSCSIHVQSEIVVPVFKNGELVGELDIDSHTKDAITPDLKKLCEEVSKKVEVLF